MTLAAACLDDVDDFLNRQGLGGQPRLALPGDASARHYERIGPAGETVLLMNSSNHPPELAAFCQVADLLRGLGLSVPAVLAADHGRGLAVVEDFGEDVFGRLLPRRTPAGQRDLYRLAVDVLIHLHRHFSPPSGITRRWDSTLLAEQAGLYLTEWQSEAADVQGFTACWQGLLDRFDHEPQSLLLRDFHVDNLMLLPRPGIAAAGVIDFQDAGLGPALYDLVSLVEDVRRPVNGARRAALLARYRTAMGLADDANFKTAVTILSAQRHTRILGVFHRLIGQGKPRYVPLIEPTKARLRALLREPVLAPLRQFYTLGQ